MKKIKNVKKTSKNTVKKKGNNIGKKKTEPKSKSKANNSMTSLEVLSHFSCGKCSKWWSIGDAVLEDRTDWFCPWCGILNKFDK